MVIYKANKTQDIIIAHVYKTKLIGSIGCLAIELKEERLYQEQEVKVIIRFNYISNINKYPIIERPQPVKKGYLNYIKWTWSILENINSLQEERGEPTTLNQKRQKVVVDNIFTIASNNDKEVVPIGNSLQIF